MTTSNITSPDTAVFTPEDLNLLNEMRVLKKTLIHKLVRTDNPLEASVPDEKPDKMLLMQLISSVDQEVMSRTKLGIESRTESNMADIKTMAAQILTNFRPNRDRDSLDGKSVEEYIAPPEDISYRAPVPGEMDIGNIPLSMKDIAE